MLYSEKPHADYVVNGVGPGAKFLGDQELWNWRYLLYGTELNDAADTALILFFNEAQRDLMRMPPLDALDALRGFMDDKVTPEIAQRALEAQFRLLPPVPAMVEKVEDNVVYANFGRKK